MLGRKASPADGSVNIEGMMGQKGMTSAEGHVEETDVMSKKGVASAEDR